MKIVSIRSARSPGSAGTDSPRASRYGAATPASTAASRAGPKLGSERSSSARSSTKREVSGT